MERVGTDAEVEAFLTGVLDEVLVGADTGGFESLGAQLFVLIGNEVNAEREVVNTGTLAAKIEDPDLGVGDTTVEPGLGIRLEQHERISLLVRYSIVPLKKKIKKTRVWPASGPIVGAARGATTLPILAE